MSWIGPAGNDFSNNLASSLIFEFMTQTSMKKDFIDEQLCTEASIYLNEQTDGEIIASFEGVKLLKLDSIIDM